MSDAPERYFVGIHGINAYRAHIADVELVHPDLSAAQVGALLRQAYLIACGYHERALEWAKKIRGLESYIDKTDSLRIANDILALAPDAQAALDKVVQEAVERATRVKPLVWKEVNDGNHKKGECFSTRSPVSFAPIAAHKKHDGWWLNVDCKTYPTLEAAKAAAQADFEARIRAAIGGAE